MNSETARLMNAGILQRPATDAKPIYDTCDYCGNPVRPGESHGIVGANAEGEPQLTCKIQRLELVEREVPATLPTSALAMKR